MVRSPCVPRPAATPVSRPVALAVALVLASRPLWMQRNLIEPGSGQAWFIAAAQRAAGVGVDGTRSYDEMTVTWLGWYLGPLTLVLAVAGTALLMRRSIVGWRPEVLVLLATLGIPALLYLIRPAITPDHIWAMRRFLPAVIPAALLMAELLVAFVAVVVANFWARKTGRPTSIVLIPAIVMLVSGTIGFRGLATMASGDMALGVHQFFQMFIVAMTLVAGIMIGYKIIQPVDSL